MKIVVDNLEENVLMISDINEKKVKLIASADAIHDYDTLRMQELEEVNTHLKSLLEEKTKEINELIQSNHKFISIIAHDLKGPFSSLLGSLEILGLSIEKYTVEEIRRLISIASESAHKTLNLLDSILMWVMSQNKEKSLNPEKINMYSVVNDELESMTRSDPNKKVKVNNLLDCNVEVRANLHMVRTIVKILMNTAVKYTYNRNQINISASGKNSFVEITISSNHIRTLDKNREDLFNFDKPGAAPDVHSEKGTHLELLLCKEFVELHGGNIKMKSELGVGCLISFTLPQPISGIKV